MKEVILEHTITMTDKQSKAYEKHAKDVYVDVNVFNDKKGKVRFATFTLYRKKKLIVEA